jgi:hypothetical protein
MMSKPHFGHTKGGLPVHLHVRDHLKAAPGAPWWDRFNSWLALKITRGVGTMWCAYVFALFDLLALPTAVHGGMYGIVQWVASFFLQLVLLSIIMVGQDVQAKASDARAAKTFEDTEVLLDRTDLKTEGGLAEIMTAITALDKKVSGGAHDPGD